MANMSKYTPYDYCVDHPTKLERFLAKCIHNMQITMAAIMIVLCLIGIAMELTQ